MGGVGDLREQGTQAAGHGDACISPHLAPIAVISAGGDPAVLVAQVHHAAQAVGVDVIGVDAGLDALAPPVAAPAGHLHVHQIQAVHITEVVAVGLRLHQHPLVDVQPGIIDHIVAEHHLRPLGAFQIHLYAGHLAVEVSVPVGVVVEDQLGTHPDAQAVVGVIAVLPVPVGAGHHLVGLVVSVSGDGDALRPGGGGGANFLLQDQVAPLVVGVAVVGDPGDGLDVSALRFAHHLVQVVVLIGGGLPAVGPGLIHQVAQAVVGVGVGARDEGVDLQLAGAASQPVQPVVDLFF